jgi:hypothetical protein
LINLQNGHENNATEKDDSEHHYENFNGSHEKKPAPPVPASNDKPVRTMADDWAEYIERTSGRAYFYHYSSGYSSWKPPRHMV